MQHNKILILDFGSQYTQLIARSLRSLHIFCEIIPFNASINFEDKTIKGVILSGSPASVNDANAPVVNIQEIVTHFPTLGICYGAQLAATQLGGTVSKSNKREYGSAELNILNTDSQLFIDVHNPTIVWMSHSDSISNLPPTTSIIANTTSIPVAAYQFLDANKVFYGLQFHPEVYHTPEGKKILGNFAIEVCKCTPDWTPKHFVTETVSDLQNQLGNNKVILALSGGVDSTVAAALLSKAIGNNLYCVFVDNGLLRKNEFENVLESYKSMGLQVKGVDAKKRFYENLQGVNDPETKRKIIGSTFIDVFDEEAQQLQGVSFLAQGTIYPDVIESVSVSGPSVTIKSHHNVGGLPEKMNLQVVEPLKLLFKDEVRQIGAELLVPDEILKRHPFPGPGLGIRIIGDISEDKVDLLQQADAIFIQILKDTGEYNKIWQAATILLPVKTVGVMGDERTYEYTVALRAVTSTDGMTAKWAEIPYDVLAKISNEIINSVKGINRVVYDISTKPPATIEWE